MMKRKSFFTILLSILFSVALFVSGCEKNSNNEGKKEDDNPSTQEEKEKEKEDDNPSTQEEVVPGNKKLVFIHHSCGGQLLADNYGGLGNALKDAGYFVSDINYGWRAAGSDDNSNNFDIGNQTDIGNWYTWFADEKVQAGKPRRDNIMGSVYTEYGQHNNNNGNAWWNFGAYTRLSADPGGENEIIMFKSCYPNSSLKSQGSESIRGYNHDERVYTVENCKDIYKSILPYFKAHPEKMFVVLTAPSRPESNPSNTTAEEAANARTLNNWMVNNWLKDAKYENRNVFVWDYFNVLTHKDNHHNVVDGKVVHTTVDGSGNMTISSYHQNGDEHPNPTAAKKATAELVPCIVEWYDSWRKWLASSEN